MVLGKSGSVFNYFEKFTFGPFKKYSTSRFYKHSVKNLSPSFFVLNPHLNLKNEIHVAVILVPGVPL